MATINIKLDDGRTLSVNAPDDSTPEELQEMAQLAAEQVATEPTKEPQSPIRGAIQQAFEASPLGSLSQQGGLLARGLEGLANTGNIPIPESVQKVGQAFNQAVTGPARGLGAGLGNFEPQQFAGLPPIQPGALAKQAERAIAGTQPGFEPQGAGEQIGAAIGEAAPAIGAGIVGGPVAGAAVASLQQAGTQGTVNTPLIALSVVPSIVGKGVKMAQSRAAAKNLIPFEKALSDGADDFVRTFNQYQDDVEQNINRFRVKYNLNESDGEQLARLRKYPNTNGLPPLNDIANKAKFISNSPDILPTSKFRELALLDQQVNAQIPWGDAEASKVPLAVKNAIRGELFKLDGPAREYIASQRQYAEFKKIAAPLKAAVEDTDIAESTLKKIASGQLKKSFTTKAEKQLLALRALEKTGGRSIVDPVTEALKTEQGRLAAAKSLNENTGILRKLGRAGVSAATSPGRALLDVIDALSIKK